MGDDISFPHMGAYGTTWIKTPGFDRVAAERDPLQQCIYPKCKIALRPEPAFSPEETAGSSKRQEIMFPIFLQKFRTFMEALDQNGYYHRLYSKRLGSREWQMTVPVNPV